MKPIHLMIHTVAVGLLLVGSPALPVCAHAQVLEFEQVGDRSLDSSDLEFGEDGTLWASAAELWELDTGTQIWQEKTTLANDHVVVLSADTVLISQNLGIRRSINRAQDWEVVYTEGGSLFASSLSGPNHGVILSGTFGGGTGIAYSTDRGATFTESTFTVSTSSRPFMNTAVEILDGPAEGRLVAGVFAGVVISEDSGQTWEPSSLFQDARFWVQRVEIGTDPATGNRRLYATVADAQFPDVQFYYSDDDGLTWTNVPGMVDAFFFVFVPGTPSSLIAVERGYDVQTERIEVWRSVDGGQTWTDAGELPAVPGDDGLLSRDMLIGPDGHLYVSVLRTGPEREWVYRTTESVVEVANEPEAPPPPTAERLVVYPNPATDRITVEASGDAGSVVLYDLLGRAVRRARLVAGKAVLDTARLPAGVYVVRAGNQGRVVTIRP